ncbi:Sodium/calcium exchanger 1 [Durusdinium trenchii]|uniref:Sodium/calcium exchanger 1 n=1 Tax=Durusdinium trenchii TaxID=1381693 RepID=A0ABP0KPU4_9DINO
MFEAWARSDVVSTMGVALYHAPSALEQARRYDAQRKAEMDHSGTSFERSYEVYPMVEPPPLANLPVSTASNEPENAEQLQSLRAEVSGRIDVGRALEQLKVEPADDAELAHKFSVYESYFASVVDLRADLFGLWERGGPLLAAADAQTMRGAIGRVDSFDNLAIPERSRHWFVYHMMSTASSNHRKMQKIMEDLEELFEADRRTAGESEELTDDPQLGTMEVIIGPAFDDIDAYNDGVKGNPSKGILAAADRGILDMDRQYNAVNFQYFAQQAEAGVTRAGAEASFKRRLCTSRLSFYIEESHGSRIFPRNILSQLSLLFYRRNDALRLANGQVNELRVAVCIRKAIPRMLRAIVLDVFQGDRNFTPHVEKAVRVYLALHQVAIKLLATFRKSYELLYQSVLEWIQQPFCAKSDAEWPDLEELLLGSSLCSVPWSLLREAFVRKLVVQLLETTTMNPKAPIRQRAEHLFNQHRNFLERLTYILSFFQAGPGKLPIQEMDKKYSRCAGTLPKEERTALVDAAKEGSGISSLDLFKRQPNEELFFDYLQKNVAAWRAAPGPTQSSEGPALPPSALEQLASIGAESGAHGWPSSTGTSRREREMHNAQRLAAEKALHQGFPKLPPSRRLDGTMCYYCQKRFPSRMALFAHLRRLIDKERFVEGHHQEHFRLKIGGRREIDPLHPMIPLRFLLSGRF